MCNCLSFEDTRNVNTFRCCQMLKLCVCNHYRPDDFRRPFGRFGRLKDIYIPRNYYTGWVKAIFFPTNYVHLRDLLRAYLCVSVIMINCAGLSKFGLSYWKCWRWRSRKINLHEVVRILCLRLQRVSEISVDDWLILRDWVSFWRCSGQSRS